jgi:hypothetical protein
MLFVRFRNGVDAPEIVLEREFETRAEAQSQLAHLTRTYGTVPDAAAWIDGDDPPKHLRGDDGEEAKPAAALLRHRASRKKAKAKAKTAAPAAPKPEPAASPAPSASASTSDTSPSDDTPKTA